MSLVETHNAGQRVRVEAVIHQFAHARNGNTPDEIRSRLRPATQLLAQLPQCQNILAQVEHIKKIQRPS